MAKENSKFENIGDAILQKVSDDPDTKTFGELKEGISCYDSWLSTKLRRPIVIAIFSIAIIWLIAVLVLLVLNGFEVFHFSDAVINGLLLSTTADIIGTVVIILKYFFNPEKH